MASPGSLDLDRSKYGAVGTFELKQRVLGLLDYLCLVRDEHHELALRQKFRFVLCHCNKPSGVDIAVSDVVLRNPLFELMHDLGDGAPLDNVLTLELQV